VSYRIELAPTVAKELLALPGHVSAQARLLLRALVEDPRPARAKELRDKPNICRIWLAARWRIAYEVDDAEQRIRILRIRPKTQIDYDSL
jgi:mRNA-degrading endonuclease RelE of RelBE toxin-antitoxin system